MLAQILDSCVSTRIITIHDASACMVKTGNYMVVIRTGVTDDSYEGRKNY